MSRSTNRAVALVAVSLLLAGIALALGQRGAPDREVVLEARDMAFYLPGDPIPNPVLRFVAGERVRITLVNAEPGIDHDLASEGLGMVLSAVRAGERASTVIEIPSVPGRSEYECRLHSRMMRGPVEVVEP